MAECMLPFIKKMKEYKIINSSPKNATTEDEVNFWAVEGWIVIGFTRQQILMEREKQDEEDKDEQILLRD
ncbi:MAG: hypothetical protein KQ78_01265 [Candidatus Izimaplasma bacterium HR2]|nr:MAG: hypothetical protein KQ78_01265 [Candidatus Izimaplasma bacterium HR2]